MWRSLLLLTAALGACVPSGWTPGPEVLPRGSWYYIRGQSEVVCPGEDPVWTDQSYETLDIVSGPMGNGLVVADTRAAVHGCGEEPFTFVDPRQALGTEGGPCGENVTVLEAQLELLRGGKVVYLRRYFDVSVNTSSEPDDPQRVHCSVFESGYLRPLVDLPVQTDPEGPYVETEEVPAPPLDLVPEHHELFEPPLETPELVLQ